jgi:thiol-disulfide isomerase/thioredoxin
MSLPALPFSISRAIRGPAILAASMALMLAACGQQASNQAKAPQVAQAKPTAEAPIADNAALEDIEQSGDARADAAGRALLGVKAPDLKLKTIDGETIDLAKLYGHKPVYLKFWATWCTVCLAQMPHFEHAYETLGNDVEVIAVNTNLNETPEGVALYRQRHGLKMPIVIDDGRLASALNLRVTPTHVLIDRSGHIAFIGHSADQKLDAELQALRSKQNLAAKPSDRTATPVGYAAQASAMTIKGETFAFKDPEGRRNTALLFFAPWCEGYLDKTQPATSAACKSTRQQADRLAASGSTRLLGVASGLWANMADMRDYEARNKVAIPLSLDKSGDLFRAYRVTKIPTIVVLDPQGKEIRRLTGDVAAFPKSVGSATQENPS